MTHPILRTSLLTLALAASFPALAAQYYVVTPVLGKKVLNSAISVTLNSYSAPAGQVGFLYPGLDLRTLLTVTGDPGYSGYGVKWQVVAGRLPAGLTLNGNGTVAGTPTEAGSATFTVRASYMTKDGEQQYQIATYKVSVSLAAGEPPPQALAGEPYSYNLVPLLSVNGDPAFTGAGVSWSVASGSLPPGLQLTPQGIITGTPSAAGTGTITARAVYQNVAGVQTYQVVSLSINVGLAGAELPTGVTGVSYAGFDFKNVLSVSGDPAYTTGAANWSLVSGSLPAGLTLNSAGVLSGTPSAANAANFTLSAAYRNKRAERTYTLLVDAAQVTGTLVAASGTDFGSVAVGQSAARSFTFTNNGNTIATGLRAAATGSSVAVEANTCGTPSAPVSLAKGASCSVTARYTPTTNGSMSGNVTVDWSRPVSGASALPITGTAKFDYSNLMAGYTSDAITIGRNNAWAEGLQWYWRSADAQISAEAGTFEFRRAITVPGNTPVSAHLYGGSDDASVALAVNGGTETRLSMGFTGHQHSAAFTLQPGVNVVSVKVTNEGNAANPAGLAIQVLAADGSVLATEHGWRFMP